MVTIDENVFSIDVVQIRMVKESSLYSEQKLDAPMKVVDLIGKYLSEMDREVICIANLNTDLKPINLNFASVGGLNSAIANPRELLKSCILSNSANIIMVHNHPSGNVLPSKDDIATTDRMVQLSDLLGIKFVDHLIVGRNSQEYFSFREKEIIFNCYEKPITKSIENLDFDKKFTYKNTDFDSYKIAQSR